MECDDGSLLTTVKFPKAKSGGYTVRKVPVKATYGNYRHYCLPFIIIIIITFNIIILLLIVHKMLHLYTSRLNVLLQHLCHYRLNFNVSIITLTIYLP